MLLSALGVASLLKAEPMLFIGLKYLGAAYLFYLGVGMLRAPGATAQSRGDGGAGRTGGCPPAVPQALLLSLSNPKAILFFISFFIQFVDPGYAYPGCRSWCWR